MLLAATAALALNNGMLRTPAMGFSDACLGGHETDRLNATELQAVATSFMTTGLAALGYTGMNLDDSWELFNVPSGKITERRNGEITEWRPQENSIAIQ